jgi:hypothetical protein
MLSDGVLVLFPSGTRPGIWLRYFDASLEISIDDLAAADKSTGRELLSRLGHLFHRINHVT